MLRELQEMNLFNWDLGLCGWLSCCSTVLENLLLKEEEMSVTTNIDSSHILLRIIYLDSQSFDDDFKDRLRDGLLIDHEKLVRVGIHLECLVERYNSFVVMRCAFIDPLCKSHIYTLSISMVCYLEHTKSHRPRPVP